MSTERTVLLIRHAETAWHADGRVLGQNDVPLNDPGMRQAEELARATAHLRLRGVISSPLSRAKATADAIATPHDVPVRVDPQLTDMRVGDWEGLKYSELEAREDYRQFLAHPATASIPNGESLSAARERALAAVRGALSESEPGSIIAIVTHSDIVRLLLSAFLDLAPEHYLRFKSAVASISAVSVREQKCRLICSNWRTSLQDVIGTKLK